jgi:hypothetical protein
MSAVDQAVEELGYLTYFSSAVERFSQSDLKRLLQVSRRNNGPRGITGLLLYRDGQFLQYLEGPRSAVGTTYEHIKIDQRHRAARLVGVGRIEGRIFPEWRMGYKNLSGIRANNTEGYSECLLANFQPHGKGDPSEQLSHLFYDQLARL